MNSTQKSQVQHPPLNNLHKTCTRASLCCINDVRWSVTRTALDLRLLRPHNLTFLEEKKAPKNSSDPPLAGEDADKLVADAFVLPKHEAHLAAAHADVTRRHIGVSTCRNRHNPHQLLFVFPLQMPLTQHAIEAGLEKAQICVCWNGQQGSFRLQRMAAWWAVVSTTQIPSGGLNPSRQGTRTDVALQLGHEGLAEAHHLPVRLALHMHDSHQPLLWCQIGKQPCCCPCQAMAVPVPLLAKTLCRFPSVQAPSWSPFVSAFSQAVRLETSTIYSSVCYLSQFPTRDSVSLLLHSPRWWSGSI